MSNKVNEFQILNADGPELMWPSQEGMLSLNLNEMQTIQSHFATLQRNPTDVGFETIPLRFDKQGLKSAFIRVIRDNPRFRQQ